MRSARSACSVSRIVDCTAENTPIDVADGTVATIDFPLGPAIGTQISGVVTDAVTGAGIGNVYVNALDGGGYYVAFGFTNPDGTYTLSLLHDRDMNRKFGFLNDGIGFPGNPRIGHSRPPAPGAISHSIRTSRTV